MNPNFMKAIWTIAFMGASCLLYCQPGGGGGGQGQQPPPGSVGAPVDQFCLLFLVGITGYSYYLLKPGKQHA
jgi:hypothetical protein